MTTSGRARALRTEDPRRTAETHLVWASQPSPDYASVTPIAGASWGARFRWPTNPACTTTTTAPLPDNLHGAGLPLVSDRIRAWLVGLGSFFELRPVTVTTVKGALEYFAVIGRGSVNCINWKQAEVTWHGAAYDSCATSARRLTLYKPNLTRGAWITPLGFPTVLLAPREPLATIPTYTGLAFVKPSLFRFALPDAGAAKISSSLERKVSTRIVAVAKQLARATEVPASATAASRERIAIDAWYHDGLTTLEEVDVGAAPEALELAHARGEAIFVAAFVAALRAKPVGRRR